MAEVLITGQSSIMLPLLFAALAFNGNDPMKLCKRNPASNNHQNFLSNSILGMINLRIFTVKPAALCVYALLLTTENCTFVPNLRDIEFHEAEYRLPGKISIEAHCAE